MSKLTDQDPPPRVAPALGLIIMGVRGMKEALSGSSPQLPMERKRDGQFPRFRPQSPRTEAAAMRIKFKSAGKSPLARHRLAFECREDLEAAVALERENGCLRFNSDEERNLVGRIVRISKERLLVEVDAAVEID